MQRLEIISYSLTSMTKYSTTLYWTVRLCAIFLVMVTDGCMQHALFAKTSPYFLMAT